MLGFYYGRKAQPKDMHMDAARGRPIVYRDELAESVGSTLVKSLPHRETKKTIISAEGIYSKFVRPDEVNRDLVCVYIWRAIYRNFNGRYKLAERKQGKWLAMFFLWDSVGSDVVSEPTTFLDEAKTPAGSPALLDLVTRTGDAIEAFFQASKGKPLARHRGSGRFALDATNFFKTPNLSPQFVAFLRSPDGAAVRQPLLESRRRFRRRHVKRVGPIIKGEAKRSKRRPQP